MWLAVNAINDVSDGVTDAATDHMVIYIIDITSELVNDVLVTSLMTLV